MERRSAARREWAAARICSWLKSHCARSPRWRSWPRNRRRSAANRGRPRARRSPAAAIAGDRSRAIPYGSRRANRQTPAQRRRPTVQPRDRTLRDRGGKYPPACRRRRRASNFGGVPPERRYIRAACRQDHWRRAGRAPRRRAPATADCPMRARPRAFFASSASITGGSNLR